MLQPTIDNKDIFSTSRRNPAGQIINGIVGNSRPLQDVMKLIQVAAPVEASVLILGENGTGKERVAERIHQLSSRSNKPLVKVNCAALPPSLVESILFGHERGAFTGAIDKRIGKFEEANEATIFLDEIGELTLDMQSRFLRVLQEREIERIGSNKSIKLNVRIIAATNRDLEKEIAEGRFRMDLYFRLNVFPIHVPSLRERREDIPELIAHFIKVYSRKYDKRVTDISTYSIKDLMSYHWPGNIRELEHLIERSVLLCETSTITMLPGFQVGRNSRFSTNTSESRIKTMEEMEHDHVLRVLEKCNGKISGNGGAAQSLGVKVSTLNSRIKKLGIEKEKIKFRSTES
jgi:transcriptional regulator with GAF, ATPase, and Fis domain